VYRCTKILVGESATHLAIKVISMTSKGRGAMLFAETTFEDQRYEGKHNTAKRVTYKCDHPMG
jgi:hypothetical protein